MELTWYGTAALVLKEGERSIAFDPFCGLPAGGFQAEESELPYAGEFCRISDVFVTHGHFDHIYHIPAIYKDRPVHIRCTKTPKETLIKNGIAPGCITRIKPDYEETVGPFTVKAYQSRHCRFDLKLIVSTGLRVLRTGRASALARFLQLNARYPENGEILLYEAACNGKRVQVLGSLNLAEGIKYPIRADLLVLPYQGRSELESYALRMVDKLKPKAVALDHWDDAFPPVSAAVDTEKFEKILQARGIPCRALQKGVTLYE